MTSPSTHHAPNDSAFATTQSPRNSFPSTRRQTQDHDPRFAPTNKSNRTNSPPERQSVEAATSEEASFKVVETFAERKDAFGLTYRVYRRAGLMESTSPRLRVMRHHLLPTTEVIIGQKDRRAIITSTLVRDGDYGVPADALFAREIDDMRDEGLKLAEVSCLASDEAITNKRDRFEYLIKTISLTIQTARRRGVDRLLLAVHPRHAKSYRRLYGCEICSDVKEYASVRGNPAVLCYHDFATLDNKRYPLFRRVYEKPFAPWQIDGSVMSDGERSYFRQAVVSAGCEVTPMAA